MPLMPIPVLRPSVPSVVVLVPVGNTLQAGLLGVGGTNQSLLSALQSMSVVSSELGVGTLQGWISRGLWPLNTACHMDCQRTAPFPESFPGCHSSRAVPNVPVPMGLLRLVGLRTILTFYLDVSQGIRRAGREVMSEAEWLDVQGVEGTEGGQRGRRKMKEGDKRYILAIVSNSWMKT